MYKNKLTDMPIYCKGVVDGERCKKQANFGFQGMKRERCASCKTEGMVILNKIRLCKCEKVRPVFGLPTDTTATCCVACKTEGMVNIVNKKCKCGKIPNFGLPTDTTPTCCSACKTEGMANIKDKKCKCGKARPSFGLPTDTTPTCCGACKTDGMVNIVSKKCKCGKIPYFGLPADTTATCCSACKTEDMVNIKDNKCKCGKIPIFGLPTDTTATCCAACKTGDMFNITHKKCQSPLCNTLANPKFRGYCGDCFSHLYPDDPIQPRQKTKELKVRAYLRENYSGFIHDKTLHTYGCSCPHRRSIDFRKIIGNTMLFIECDETQHRGYTDEEIRYNDLVMVFGGKWIFIRFNPDNYRINGELKKTKMETRFNRLKREIDRQISRIENEENTELLEIVKLYFNYNDETINTPNQVKYQNQLDPSS